MLKTDRICTGCGAIDIDTTTVNVYGKDEERCIDCASAAIQVDMETLCLAEEMIGATIELALLGHMHPDDLRGLVEHKIAECCSGGHGPQTSRELHEAWSRNLVARVARKKARLVAAGAPQRLGEEV